MLLLTGMGRIQFVRYKHLAIAVRLVCQWCASGVPVVCHCVPWRLSLAQERVYGRSSTRWQQ
jgi:hypothetical protein